MPSFIDYYNYSYPELVDIWRELDKSDEFSVLSDHDLELILSEFNKRGIKELAYLLKRLRKKKSIIHYSRELDVSEDYLNTLKSWLQSLVPRARPLTGIPIVKPDHFEYLASLKTLGITNTYHLLDKASTSDRRNNLCGMLGISQQFLSQLVSWADLYRLRGISSSLLQQFVDLGITSLTKLIQCDTRYVVSKIPQTIQMNPELLEQYKKEAKRNMKRLKVVW